MIGAISFIGSGMFILGSACKTAKGMRIAMLIGAVIFCFVFACSGLNNGVNLSNFILNATNVVLHIYHLSSGMRKRHSEKKLVERFAKVA